MRVYIFILVGFFALLSGCQTVPEQVKPQPSPIEPEAIAKTVTPVIHQPAEIKPAPVTDVWERIRRDLVLPVPDEKLVNHYRDWYIKHPQHLKLVSQRATPFLYLIVDEVEKRNLPMELALLPIIESSFDPFAYSQGAASGLWQFTSPMARHFGLQMNWWYDGRRDVPAATIAALDMLEYLHGKTHKNWLYAVAAYNTGEGRVLNAVRRNRKAGKNTDFWSLRLPKETERYVPQLLALADVVKNADKYGIELTPIANEPQIKIVQIGSQIDLALAAKMAGLTTAQLHRLNPGFNRWATAPKGPHALVLPIKKAPAFEKALAETKVADRLKWDRYKIQEGDSLSVIAQKYGTTSAALRSVNGIEGNNIRAGRYLLIPVAAKNPSQYALSVGQRKAHIQNRNRGKNKQTYKVKSGDSLWLIAKKHNVKVDSLARWNSMAPKDRLKIGQSLVIWSGKPKTTTKANSLGKISRTINYHVKRGESLAIIAARFKVAVKDIIRWNKLEKAKYIQPGQLLIIYVDMTKVRA